MYKPFFSLGKPLSCMALLALLGVSSLPGCSSKAGIDSPQMPPRHWLEDAPGVPVENQEKLDASVESLYSPDKVFDFDECVFLSIQQSPLLVKSAVNIEIKRLAVQDSLFKYLPEPSITFIVTSNITQFNHNIREPSSPVYTEINGLPYAYEQKGNLLTPEKYGQLSWDVSYSAPFPNPVATFLEHKTQKLLVNIAIATHRKAVSEVIENLAGYFLQVNAQDRIIEMQKELIPFLQKEIDYLEKLDSIDGGQGTFLTQARGRLRQAELAIEQSTMQRTIFNTRLKMTAGVDPQQPLQINAADIKGLLDYLPKTATWEERWPQTEDSNLLDKQIELSDYNILLAWAQYIPNFSMNASKTPPEGMYTPRGGTDDWYFNLSFSFPLIDWGRRHRGVQKARMEKAQEFNERARKRTMYSNEWLQAEQNIALAETEVKIAQNELNLTEARLTEAQINYDNGLTNITNLTSAQAGKANARIRLVSTQVRCDAARLKLLALSGVLQERYLGLPGHEKEKKDR